MFVLITFAMLIFSALILIGVRIMRPGFQYAWLIAAGGSLIAWISIFFWRMSFPATLILSKWEPIRIFTASPALIIDPIGWAFAFSIAALTAAVIVTSVVRWKTITPVAWSGTLILSALGMIAVLAENPLTLVLAWTAIDLLEMTNMIRAMQDAPASERVVTAFSVRIFGTGLVLWASLVAASNNAIFNFNTIPPSVGIYLLLAAGLRLGVLPFHLPYAQEMNMRRGLGTTLRIIPAAASLIVLARIQYHNLPDFGIVILMALNSIAALYGSWKWLRSRNELEGRPYWLMGMAALALGASLRGNPEGAAAWGLAMILIGGNIFLYSARKAWITRVLMIAILGISSLPFTLTASAWLGDAPWDMFFLPIYLIAQALIAAGLFRHVRRGGDQELDQQPQWAQVTYPAGIILPVFAMILLGLWGWDGALMIGSWITAIAACVLIILIGILITRIPNLIPRAENESSTPAPSPVRARISAGLWGVYRLIGRGIASISFLLEGDGGLLWTALLLVLFISIIQGAR